MPLLSIEFAVFFIVFLPLYWAFARLPQVQNVLLLVAGLGWLYRIDPIFAALILVYSSVVYLISVLMFSENENIRKFWLGCGISAALTVLCFFKYFDFFRPIIQQYTGQSAVIDILCLWACLITPSNRWLTWCIATASLRETVLNGTSSYCI